MAVVRLVVRVAAHGDAAVAEGVVAVGAGVDVDDVVVGSDGGAGAGSVRAGVVAAVEVGGAAEPGCRE